MNNPERRIINVTSIKTLMPKSEETFTTEFQNADPLHARRHKQLRNDVLGISFKSFDLPSKSPSRSPGKSLNSKLFAGNSWVMNITGAFLRDASRELAGIHEKPLLTRRNLRFLPTPDLVASCPVVDSRPYYLLPSCRLWTLLLIAALSTLGLSWRGPEARARFLFSSSSYSSTLLWRGRSPSLVSNRTSYI